MKKEGIFFTVGFSVLYVLVIVLFLANPYTYVDNDPLSIITRLAALLGLTSLFVASVLTPFQKEVYKAYKKSALKIHHIFTIAGLILITLHPVAFAINVALSKDFVSGLAVFVPNFESFYKFWLLAGRPALILFYIALVAALLRKSIKNWWRGVHIINYFALVFGVVHGFMIGSDFYNFFDSSLSFTASDSARLLVSILFLLMTIAATVTFTLKRIQLYKSWKRKQARKQKEQATATEQKASEAKTDPEVEAALGFSVHDYLERHASEAETDPEVEAALTSEAKTETDSP